MTKLTKEQVQQRVLKDGKPLALDLFTWDEETSTFSSKEERLILDFSGINNCVFNVWDDCIIKTGNNCILNTECNCILDSQDNCTLTVEDCCTIRTGNNCILNTGYNCVADTGGSCKLTMQGGYILHMGTNCEVIRPLDYGRLMVIDDSGTIVNIY